MERHDGRILKGHLDAFSLDGRLTAGASFVFDGSSSDGLLSRWSSRQVGPIANGLLTLLFDDPETGLQVRLLVTQLPYESALEWRLEFTNPTDHDLPVLESIRSLDISLEVEDAHRPLLRSLHGSTCAASDFLPIELAIYDGQPIRLEPVGGRSSDTAMPFFCIVIGGRQYAFAIGWSGQWIAELNLDGGRLRVRAGLADAALTLRPGETIRAPSVLMLGNTSSQPDATSRLRTVLGDHYAPTSVDGGPVTPIAHMTMANFHSTGITSEEAELAAVEQGSRLGLDAHWIDACWYGDSSNWYEQVGNWVVRKEIFPRGLRPIADAAHQAGMKFVFWMEPERARVDSALARSHPEFFLAIPGDEDNLLLDLGRADAREYVLNLISGYISEFAVDIYRQDFNIAPLEAWRNADEPARAGLTENRYIEGLYALWDALLERHPGLVIDNCASGGRRIDLETTRRSVPLWRSDFVDLHGGAEAVGISITNQMQTCPFTGGV